MAEDMTNLINFPCEILDRIFYYADQESLRQLRLTCLAFANIGRSWAFHTVVIRPNPENYEKLDKILADPDICQAVRKINLDIRKWHPYHDIEIDYNDNEAEENAPFNGDEDNHYLPQETLRVFTHLLKKSTRFRSVAVRFHHEFYAELSHLLDERQHQNFRQNVMGQVMTALLPEDGTCRLPRELAIQNLHNINAEDENVAGKIARVLGGGLQALRLNITNEHRQPDHAELDFDTYEAHAFHSELYSHWIKPTMSSLRHLTLYSSLYFGYYPKLDLRGTHLPHLRTLSLGNHCFVHDSQLDWILSHASTLTELYLDNCPLLFQVCIKRSSKENTYLDPRTYAPQENESSNRYFAAYDSRWCDYFRAFERGLPHLRHFRYGKSLDLEEEEEEEDSLPFENETRVEIGLGKESYLVFCDEQASTPYVDRMLYMRPQPDGEGEWVRDKPLRPSEEDRRALKDLCAKIGQMV